MRLTLYLPDALGRAAKDAGLNLSGLLRAAVDRELRGERMIEDAKRIPGAVLTSRPVPGGVELVLFVPEGSGLTSKP